MQRLRALVQWTAFVLTIIALGLALLQIQEARATSKQLDETLVEIHKAISELTNQIQQADDLVVSLDTLSEDLISVVALIPPEVFAGIAGVEGGPPNLGN